MAVEKLPSRWDDTEFIRGELGDDAALRQGIPPEDYYTGLYDSTTVFPFGTSDAVVMNIAPPIDDADLAKCEKPIRDRFHILQGYSSAGPAASAILINAPRSRARVMAIKTVHHLSEVHDKNVAAAAKAAATENTPAEDAPAPDQTAD